MAMPLSKITEGAWFCVEGHTQRAITAATKHVTEGSNASHATALARYDAVTLNAISCARSRVLLAPNSALGLAPIVDTAACHAPSHAT